MKLATFASTVALTSSAFAAGHASDKIDGYSVIENLDLSEVPANQISRYWIAAAYAQGGLPYFLPVYVARGSAESLSTGPKVSFGASIHGDELNGVAVVQRFFQQLDASGVVEKGEFNGTIIGTPTLNVQGNLLNQRNFFSSSNNGFFTDMNRVFPGEFSEDGGAIYDSYVATIWNKIWGNGSNVDYAVDLHTLSTGSDGPLWVYADYELDGVRRLAELGEVDVIKIDPGQEGTIETTFVSAGIPAITMEVGRAKAWTTPLINRAIKYCFRLLEDLSMTKGNGTQVDLSSTHIATTFSSVLVKYSGWVDMKIEPLDDVDEGQEVGTVYNSWGDVLQTLRSEVTGKVLTVAVDPAVEQGADVATIVYNETSSEA